MPRFKEQFAIPHPTKDYEEILSSVPEEYVGPVSRVMPIVQVMGARDTWVGQERMEDPSPSASSSSDHSDSDTLLHFPSGLVC